MRTTRSDAGSLSNEGNQPSRRFAPASTIRLALRIREWALEIFSTSSSSRGAAARKSPPDDTGAWRLFLETERCARPLASTLVPRFVELLSPEVRSVLQDRAYVETQRVLLARGRLRDAAACALSTHVRAVILKGGVLLPAQEPALDLSDIDVLVPEDVAVAFHECLRERGYSSDMERRDFHHLSPLYGKGGVPIEVHDSLWTTGESVSADLFNRAQPLQEPADGIYRLATSDHLWHTLVHSTVYHLCNRGRVRDLLLIAHALANCSESEFDQIEARVQRHPQRQALRSQFEMASAIALETRVRDFFRETAASRYVVWSGLRPLGAPRGFSAGLADAAAAALAGEPERSRLRSEVFRLPAGKSSFRIVRTVEDFVPFLGRTWRVGLRMLKFGISWVLGGCVMILARWISSTQPCINDTLSHS